MNRTKDELIMETHEIVLQKKLLNKSSSRYKSMVDDFHERNFKCSQIGYWLELHSKKLVSECKTPKSNFIAFKPGALIRVDFGVNVGNEISGQHFAVVLNKNDSSFKGTLTVVPLTSKNKKWYVDIKMEVYNGIINQLGNTVDEESKKIEKVTKVRELMIEYLNEKNADSNSVSASKIIQALCIMADIKEDDIFTVGQTPQDIANTLENLFDLFEDKLDEIQANNVKFQTLITKYENYKKNSFADVTQVTTISKNRIVSRINEFDPMGTATISVKYLGEIRDAIKKQII